MVDYLDDEVIFDVYDETALECSDDDPSGIARETNPHVEKLMRHVISDKLFMSYFDPARVPHHASPEDFADKSFAKA